MEILKTMQTPVTGTFYKADGPLKNDGNFLEALLNLGGSGEKEPSALDRMPMGVADRGVEEKKEDFWDKRVKAFEEAQMKDKEHWAKQKLTEFEALKRVYLSANDEEKGAMPTLPISILLAGIV